MTTIDVKPWTVSTAPEPTVSVCAKKEDTTPLVPMTQAPVTLIFINTVEVHVQKAHGVGAALPGGQTLTPSVHETSVEEVLPGGQ